VESPFHMLEKKKKNVQKVVQEHSADRHCFKILVLAGTRIKFLSAGLKIGVSADTVLKN
jgi:hypothetical protein